MPSNVLRSTSVPLANCHELYVGTVTQTWRGAGPAVHAHVFRYDVDLLDAELDGVAGFGPWAETSGVTYWVGVQAEFSEAGSENSGWGWATALPGTEWNNASVVSTGTTWSAASYPSVHPSNGIACDLAFALTTDEPATSRWYGPLEMTDIDPDVGGTLRLGSVGDLGAGVIVLQYSTNLPGTNWYDIREIRHPDPPPRTTFWYRVSPVDSNTFYRIIQR